MVYMKGCFLPDLRQLTVLAPIESSESDLLAHTGIDVAHWASRSVRNRNQVRSSAKFTSPSASARSSGLNAWPES